MSQINNILTTTFRAVGGNVVSTLNQYGSGMSRLGGAIQENTNMSQRFNEQWRAIGTTIRYALAGTAVFGLTRMVGQLKDVNNQLALMSAIGSGAGGQTFSFNQVTDLGNQLQQTAVNSITPVQDINDATINFLSTVQNVPRNQIPSIMEDIAKGARLAQTPVEDLTQAATTMNIAFGRANNAKNIGQFTRMWYALISTAPGGISAAPTIAQSMPGLASMFQLAPGHTPGGVGQSQMMGLTLGVLRTGMPAATAMRGLTYLLQSIAQPTGGAKTALAGIGITPQFIQQHGVFQGVMKLLHTIRPVSSRQAKQLGAIDDPTMDTLDTSGGNLPGISANEMVRLRAMIPRIHGIRAAIILSSQLQARGSVASLQTDVQDMANAEANHAKAAQDMNKAWQRASQRMKLQQATVAINQMGLQVAQMFEPVLNFIAGGPIGLSHLMTRHRHGAAVVGQVAGGVLGAAALAHFFGIGGRAGGLVGRAASGGIMAKGFLTGNPGIPGQTPQNPLFVAVVNPQLYGPGKFPNVPGGGTKEEEKAGQSFFRKMLGGRAASMLAGRAGFAAAGSSATIAAIALAQKGDQGPTMHNKVTGRGIRWSPTGRPYRFRDIGIPGQMEHDIFQLPMHVVHGLIEAQARRVLGGNVSAVSNYGVGMWHGQTDVNLTITRENADGTKTKQRVHIPVDMWARGRHPGHRGQPKTVRTR